MLPNIVAAGHTKYMVFLPLHLRDMRSLPQTHPYIYEQFKSGHFTVSRKEGSFNGIWTDMALEQTFNREGKTTLLTRIAQGASARDKYMYLLAAPLMTKVFESVKSMAPNVSDAPTDDSVELHILVRETCLAQLILDTDC